MADENAVLMYKGRPLMRKDNMIYYGSMADTHIVMLQILESKKQGDTPPGFLFSSSSPIPPPRAGTALLRRAKKTDSTPPWMWAACGWNALWQVSNF